MGADPSLFSLQLSVLKWKSVQVDGVLVACDNEAISLQCHVLLGAGPVVCWGRGVCCGGWRSLVAWKPFWGHHRWLVPQPALVEVERWQICGRWWVGRLEMLSSVIRSFPPPATFVTDVQSAVFSFMLFCSVCIR